MFTFGRASLSRYSWALSTHLEIPNYWKGSESYWNFLGKFEEEKSLEKMFENLVIPCKVVLFSRNYRKCCSVSHWKFPEIEAGNFWWNRKNPICLWFFDALVIAVQLSWWWVITFDYATFLQSIRYSAERKKPPSEWCTIQGLSAWVIWKSEWEVPG